MVYLYSLAINLYVVFIKLASLFNNKASSGAMGERIYLRFCKLHFLVQSKIYFGFTPPLWESLNKRVR